MAFIEKKTRVPGFVSASAGARTLTCMNLDFSFFNWGVQRFVLKGFYFSIMLTAVATIGGIVFGTMLALMRLSGKKGWMRPPPSTSTACAPSRW
jgi:ABC-type amino acid transport system permease subunit